jgi:hypothetical protein
MSQSSLYAIPFLSSLPKTKIAKQLLLFGTSSLLAMRTLSNTPPPKTKIAKQLLLFEISSLLAMRKLD